MPEVQTKSRMREAARYDSFHFNGLRVALGSRQVKTRRWPDTHCFQRAWARRTPRRGHASCHMPREPARPSRTYAVLVHTLIPSLASRMLLQLQLKALV